MAVTVDDTAGLVVSRSGLSVPVESVLVGNSGQSGNQIVTYSSDHGQAFTTGNSPNGYAVGSVTVISEDPENDPIDLKICEVDEDGAPTEDCTGLTAPGSFARGSLVFTVPDGSPPLAPGTTYMLVFKAPGAGTTVQVGATSSDSEDFTSLPGWSIRNRYQQNNPVTGWQIGSGRAIRIVISGTVAGLSLAEGATGTYTVALTSEPSADVTVTISGQAGTDVSLSGLTNNLLTFTTGNWDTSQTVTVTAAHDPDEVDDEVTLTHTTASTDVDYEGLALGMPVTVTDDDTAGLVVSRTGLSLPVESVLVGNSGQSGNQSVTYSSDHGQAFTTGNSSNGYTVTSVTIVSEDPNADPIDLKICAVGTGGAPTEDCTDLTPPGSFARGPLVFTVPDGSPPFAPGTTHMLVFKAPNSGAVRVGATGSDSEDSASLPGWSIRNRFQWKSSTDWQNGSGGRSIRIIISGTVAERRVVAEGATGAYTVALATEPSADVTVTISGQAGTDVSLDKTSLTFTTGNWDTSQPVAVTAAHDPDEVDDEVTLTHTTASADTDYEGLTKDTVVTVDDDDTPVVLVSNSGQSANQSVTYSSDHGQAFTTGNNSNGYAVDSVTIVSEDPETDPIDLKICAVDGDGAPTEDCTDLTPPGSFARGPLVFTVPDGSPPFAPGTTHMLVFKTPNSGAVRVGATNSDGEDSASLPGWSIRNIFQWNSTTGWQDGSGGRSIRIIINGTAITDDEVAGVTIVPDTGLSVGEGDTATYTVVLDSEPSAAVTVNLTGSGDLAAVTVSPTVLTFTTGNWATAQTVTVTAVQDNDADDETVDVSHTAASTDFGLQRVAGIDR